MMVVFLNLLFTDAIFAGIIKGVNDRKIDYQFGEILIEPKIGDHYITRTSEIIEKYKDDSKVVKIGKELKLQARFINEKNKDGRDFEELGANLHNLGIQEVFDIKSKIIAGRMLKEDDFGKIIIGSAMAGGYPGAMTSEDLGSVRPGDKITVEVGRAKKEFEIVGIYKSKNSALDKDAIITDREMTSLIGDKNLASDVVIRLADRGYSEKFLSDFRSSEFKEYVISD
jgi:ABC-type lipoprotein release transport system permease subunit